MSNGPSIDLGGNGVFGSITLRNGDGEEGVRLGGEGNITVTGMLSSNHLVIHSIHLTNEAGQITVSLAPQGVSVGGGGEDGRFVATDPAGQAVAILGSSALQLSRDQLTASLGAGGLFLQNEAGHTTVGLAGPGGALALGGGGAPGSINLMNPDGQLRIRMDAQLGDIRVSNHEGHDLTVMQDGVITLRNATDQQNTSLRSNGLFLQNEAGHTTVALAGAGGALALGGGGAPGSINLMNPDGQVTIIMDAQLGHIRLSNHEGHDLIVMQDGVITVSDADQNEVHIGGNRIHSNNISIGEYLGWLASDHDDRGGRPHPRAEC